jgi:hypothetical protein
MRRNFKIRSLVVAALIGVVAFPMVAYGSDSGGAAPQRHIEAISSFGSAFTFQGRLTDGGSAAAGIYDFTFTLYDSNSGGAVAGPVNTLGDVSVSAGLFTVTLDFGNVFHGGQYYLDIAVRPGASAGAYTALTPREAITSVPNAQYAARPGQRSLSRAPLFLRHRRTPVTF